MSRRKVFRTGWSKEAAQYTPKETAGRVVTGMAHSPGSWIPGIWGYRV